MNILATGVTGYIGGRLVPRLIDRGYNVRCMARDVNRIKGRWENSELVYGDVTKFDSIDTALKNIDIAYYLIHSMSAGEKDFVDIDLKAAENFSYKAKENGVKRIIYLGGLGNKSDNLSPHLLSRQMTGEMLRKSGLPVTEFRAGMIVGSGSLSFEMMRYLAERVPVMICPKWVKTKTQPVAVRDILRYLIESIENEESAGKTLEIGSDDILSYRELIMKYADIRGLKRFMINVPVLTPRLSSYWVDLVTPIPNYIARPLIEGLKNEIIVKDNTARNIFNFQPISYEDAVRFALDRHKSGKIETIWSNAVSSTNPANYEPVNLKQIEGMIIEKRETEVNASAENVFSVILKLGGNNGWYANFLWQARGLLDRLFGGVGMRRGRRSPDTLIIGEPLDFWRVEELLPDELLRLRAEMKLPGKAWLQFSVKKIGENKSLLNQTAFYEPKGLAGVLYWYSIYFLHKIIFGGMINDIKRKAEKRTK
ncbi:MAG: SDR family oxidoreductase [Ignavibacteria bacterium]|jgi:uncharacterized protein YbjT (DUF2867 family)